MPAAQPSPTFQHSAPPPHSFSNSRQSSQVSHQPCNVVALKKDEVKVNPKWLKGWGDDPVDDTSRQVAEVEKPSPFSTNVVPSREVAPATQTPNIPPSREPVKPPIEFKAWG